jgi:hypothetical protein
MIIAARVTRVQGVETLAVHYAAVIELGRVRRVLDGATEWLGPEVEAPAGYRRYLGDLAYPLLTRPRTLLFRKAALVDIGPPARLPDGSVSASIAWRSATLAPLFPVFAGRLRIQASGLRLDGAYGPPFGDVGRLIDRAALHQVAVRTARWFLSELASRLTPELAPDRDDRSAADPT